jgi:hypothetical protein
MVGHVILFVLGILIMWIGVPVTSVFLAWLSEFLFKDTAPIGFIVGWIVGLVVAGAGLVLAIIQGIEIAHLIWG